MNKRFGIPLTLFLLQIAFCALPPSAHAVPETTAVRVTDVTTSSFSVVWMTDVPADPSAEVYADAAMLQRLAEGVSITPMPAGSAAAAQAAKTKCIMKVRVAGVQPGTTYYVRTVTRDPQDSGSVSYSGLKTVTTASNVELYLAAGGAAANDLAAFPVYIRPVDQADEPGLGDLVILERQGSPYPVSAFAGDGAPSSEGILDLNNLFGEDGANLAVAGDEMITLTIYREGTLSTLTHYRRTPQNSAAVSVVDPVKGFFADINLDGKVDDGDFTLFRAQYRTAPDDASYNPDYNFVLDAEGRVNAKDFSKFSKEYGRTDVQ